MIYNRTVVIPADYNGGKLPAIVVVTPASGIKEQTAGLYAEKNFRKLVILHWHLTTEPTVKVNGSKPGRSFSGILIEIIDKVVVYSLPYPGHIELEPYLPQLIFQFIGLFPCIIFL